MPNRSSQPSAGRLVLVHSADPEALFRHASAPFCVPGRIAHRLPLLAVRQGGLRDQLQERAARAGCAGWVGDPVVVFAELPTLLAGELAPLSTFERRAILDDLLQRTALRRLGAMRTSRGVVDAIDALFGDLVSERVEPERLTSTRLTDDGAWAAARDEDLRALYAGYLGALARLPKVGGVARSDGRDGRTLAAEAIRERPDEVRRRLRRPFGEPDEPVTIAIHGLNDLRRGWDHLLDALRAAPFVDEVRVYLPLDHVVGPEAEADRIALEAIGEHELRDALVAREPAEIVRLPRIEPRDALATLHHTLFRPPTALDALTSATPVRALASPDMARELDEVARRVKRLIVDGGVAPNAIAVVSRKSRPYGPRMVDALRRHGVPVSARIRTNLAEVSAVAALLRVFRTGADGYAWRTLTELAESPYFDLSLDVGLLKRASTRGRHRSLAAWHATLQHLAVEAGYESGSDEYRGPDAARVTSAVAGFAEFRAVAEDLASPRTYDEWIGLALRCLGRDAAGERAGVLREGLWGLCRNACRLPHDESDALLVEATRRDIEALAALSDLLMEWRAALPVRKSDATERLTAREWQRALLDALEDVEITVSTPHRRGVQVLEASAAVWRSFEHLFLVGLSAGEFPAEPAGRELFAEHEREARYAAGLPLDPARVWFAREASLLRMLVGGTRASLHVSYAYADANGSTQIPSAYFDEILSRFEVDGERRPNAEGTEGAENAEEHRAAASRTPRTLWPETQPGSAVVPPTLDDVWCVDDLMLFAARGWSDGTPGRRTDAETAIAQLARDAERRGLLARVLAAAGTEHARRALRATPAPTRPDALRPWNGAITSPDLLTWLDARFADRTWSASQLEAYGRCPFTFFARHVLDLRATEEPDEEMDGATRGALVHVCLDRLHAGLAADLGDAAFTSDALERAARLIPTVVRRALDEFEKTGRGGVPALRAVRERELEALLGRYLAWEIAENEKAQRRATPRRRPLTTELVFGMNGTPPVALQRGGRVLKLRGKIDRVDELVDDAVRGWRYVVDHKTSDASLKPLDLYDEGALLQLPLYLLALDRMTDHRGSGVWGGAYQIVKDECGRSAALHPRTLTNGVVREGSNKTEQTAASRMHDALTLAFRHVDGATRGEFPAQVAKAAKTCPTFCDMKDVCREDRMAKGGPRR
jgi:RecB family exonuclease